MSDAFFLPVGRDVTIECVHAYEYSGELKGVINFGGIPAVWLQSKNDNGEINDHVCLIQNVIAINITKEKSKIIDGGLFV
jgi:hypothetical protein